MEPLGLSRRLALLRAGVKIGTLPARPVMAVLDAMRPLPETLGQLQRSAQMVENSTLKIMDTCDRIRACVEDLRAGMMAATPPLEADLMATLESTLDEISGGVVQVYELCNFQDLNAQSHNRAMNILTTIQDGIGPLQLALGTVAEAPPNDEQKAILQQDEIDSLLDAVCK